MKNVIPIIALISCFLNTHSQTVDYYVKNGSSITKVKGDPAKEKANCWTIKLYRKNVTPHILTPAWGELSAKTYGEVTAQLKKQQEFQKMYAKFMNEDYTQDELTYFNYLGPIATFVEESSVATLNKIYEQSEKVNRFMQDFEVVKKIALSISPDAKINQYKNPVKAAGEVMKDYIKSLKDAITKFTGLNSNFNVINNFAQKNVNEELEAMNKEIASYREAAAGFAREVDVLNNLSKIKSNSWKQRKDSSENGKSYIYFYIEIRKDTLIYTRRGEDYETRRGLQTVTRDANTGQFIKESSSPSYETFEGQTTTWRIPLKNIEKITLHLDEANPYYKDLKDDPYIRLHFNDEIKYTDHREYSWSAPRDFTSSYTTLSISYQMAKYAVDAYNNLRILIPRKPNK